MYLIEWTDGSADWSVRFKNWKLAYKYLSQVFYEAKLVDDNGVVVGGVRPVRPGEKTSRRHKWWRWIGNESTAAVTVRFLDPPETEVSFMKELEKLD